jgi:hypothetical protein
MLNREYLYMYKYGKGFSRQLFCNKLLCSTVYNYTEKRN